MGWCSNLGVIWTGFMHTMLHFGLIEICSNHIFYYFNRKLYLLYMCWSLQSAFFCHMSNTTRISDFSVILKHSFRVCCIIYLFGTISSLFIFLDTLIKMTNIGLHLSIFWYRPNQTEHIYKCFPKAIFLCPHVCMLLNANPYITKCVNGIANWHLVTP